MPHPRARRVIQPGPAIASGGGRGGGGIRCGDRGRAGPLEQVRPAPYAVRTHPCGRCSLPRAPQLRAAFVQDVPVARERVSAAITCRAETAEWRMPNGG